MVAGCVAVPSLLKLSFQRQIEVEFGFVTLFLMLFYRIELIKNEFIRYQVDPNLLRVVAEES